MQKQTDNSCEIRMDQWENNNLTHFVQVMDELKREKNLDLLQRFTDTIADLNDRDSELKFKFMIIKKVKFKKQE